MIRLRSSDILGVDLVSLLFRVDDRLGEGGAWDRGLGRDSGLSTGCSWFVGCLSHA